MIREGFEVHEIAPREIFPFRPGDIVYLKKPHPCGSHEWEILRIGSDLKLRCVGCDRQMMVERRMIDRHIKRVSRPAATAADEREVSNIRGYKK